MSDETTRLAEAAFIAGELYRAHQMVSVPTDYEARKAAYVEYAKAQEEFIKAKRNLEDHINGRRSITEVLPDAQKTLQNG